MAHAWACRPVHHSRPAPEACRPGSVVLASLRHRTPAAPTSTTTCCALPWGCVLFTGRPHTPTHLPRAAVPKGAARQQVAPRRGTAQLQGGDEAGRRRRQHEHVRQVPPLGWQLPLPHARPGQRGEPVGLGGRAGGGVAGRQAGCTWAGSGQEGMPDHMTTHMLEAGRCSSQQQTRIGPQSVPLLPIHTPPPPPPPRTPPGLLAPCGCDQWLALQGSCQRRRPGRLRLVAHDVRHAGPKLPHQRGAWQVERAGAGCAPAGTRACVRSRSACCQQRAAAAHPR